MLDKLSKLSIPWALLLGMMAGFLLYQVHLGFPVETNILKLLPETRRDPVTEQAWRQFETATGRKTIFLVGSEEPSSAKRAAEQVYQRMLESEVFYEISYRVDPQRARKTYEIYLPHRQSLLSKEQRQWLLDEDVERIVNQATNSLMSPISLSSSASLTKDPLFTFVEFLKELQSEAGGFSMDDDLLLVEHGGKHYVVLVGELQENAFSMSAQARFSDFYGAVLSDLNAFEPRVEAISAGVIHHALAGTDSARGDISTIGLGSIAGLVLLMLLAFRSLTPLLVSAVPILAGCIAALTLCILAFEKVHLFTLVFGCSLIGISIDYSFHYLAERFSAGENWNSNRGLKTILPGITLGLITSLCAYLALAIAPFSGLQQIALFSTVGLSAAYLTVVLWFPFFLKSSVPRVETLTLKLARNYVSFWDGKKPRLWKLGLLLVALALLVYLALNLFANDDIRTLQSSPLEVMEQERLVQEIVGSSSGTQFFIVQGFTENDVLSTEEQLTALLDQEVEKGHLARYRAISKVLPSPSRQQQNYSLLREQALRDSSPVSAYLTDMGFEDEIVDLYRRSFQAESQEPLTIARWLESPLRDLYAPLWMEGETKDEATFASIVILNGVSHLEALREVEDKVEGIAFVSRADDVSELLQEYRQLSTWLVAGAYLFIFLLRLFRYRWRIGFSMMVPPLYAGLIALSVSAMLGIGLNLFNTLALILVLGIGIDYTIFFAEKPDHRETTMHAVLLSALTTILSFGLLALSATPVISSFGVMAFVGILVSLLLAPVVGCKTEEN